MNYYKYNNNNRYYIGTIKAQKDPKNPGSYLKPTNSTFVELLPFRVGHKRKFVDGEWIYEEIDYNAMEAEINLKARKIALSKTLFSKLEIRRAMRVLGIEEKLNNLLTNLAFATDWNDSIEVDLSDDITKQALNQGSISDDEINNIKLTIAGLEV